MNDKTFSYNLSTIYIKILSITGYYKKTKKGLKKEKACERYLSEEEKNKKYQYCHIIRMI